MVHIPCGVSNDNTKAPCLDEDTKKCKKNFPKDFTLYTQFDDSAFYPLYQRRNTSDGGRSFDRYNRGIQLTQHIDNSYIVPYNPYLLLKYNCHMNIEVCYSHQCIKYLFKYVSYIIYTTIK